jgi:hypothetical protein
VVRGRLPRDTLIQPFCVSHCASAARMRLSRLDSVEIPRQRQVQPALPRTDKGGRAWLSNIRPPAAREWPSLGGALRDASSLVASRFLKRASDGQATKIRGQSRLEVFPR